MLEKLAKSIEEVNVLAEHYRTCQNVAAIESLAKEAFLLSVFRLLNRIAGSAKPSAETSFFPL